MSKRTCGALAAAVLAAACGFNPTSPFDGFDEQGTRLRGTFDQVAVAAMGSGVTAASASPQGLRVVLREKTDLAAPVGADGRFSLKGLPAGSWSLLFLRDGQEVGDIRFQSVRQNQEITIVVALTAAGEVVLLSEKRDRVSFEGECPRSPGFWCQNQRGQNPNLLPEDFQKFSQAAAELLKAKGLEALDTPEEIAAAVCNTGDQLLRQLATLALNLAAGTLQTTTPLQNEPYPTVGDALDAAVAMAKNPSASREERNRIKDVLERINTNQNTGLCEATDDDPGDDDGEPPAGKLTICHIPPGNPSRRHTLEIDASAWPAHRAHRDTLGACSG